MQSLKLTNSSRTCFWEMSFHVPLLPPDLLHSRKHKYWLKQIFCCMLWLWGGRCLEQQNQWELVLYGRILLTTTTSLWQRGLMRPCMSELAQPSVHVCSVRECNILTVKATSQVQDLPYLYSYFHYLNGIKA